MLAVYITAALPSTKQQCQLIGNKIMINKTTKFQQYISTMTAAKESK